MKHLFTALFLSATIFSSAQTLGLVADFDDLPLPAQLNIHADQLCTNHLQVRICRGSLPSKNLHLPHYIISPTESNHFTTGE